MAFNPDPIKIHVKKDKQNCRVVNCSINAIAGTNFCKGHTASLKAAPKRNKKPKAKKKATPRAKAKAAFQKWVRLRDADKFGICVCITSGKRTVWNKNTDGGHFRPAHLESTCFDPRNVNSQSKIANLTHMQLPEVIAKYAENIDKKWGKGTAEDLRIKSLHIMKRSKFEYEQIEKHYKKLAKELQKEKGL